MGSRVLAVLATVMVAAFGAMGSLVVAGQQTKRAGDIELPPILWTCPMVGVQMPDGSMHGDVVEDREGNCPICKMKLVAVRLETIYTCPVHSVVAERKPGVCPIDHRELVQTTVQLSWTCTAFPSINELTPGKCPDGSPMIEKHTPRPHGNHNPQHGGQFFMAPDGWHHLEGTFPTVGVARIYLYDDFTRPLPAEQMNLVSGRIVTKEASDKASNVPKEVTAFPLTLARTGQYLEARVDRRALPAPMTAKIKFKRDGPEYRFDFTFAELSKDVAPSTPARSASTVARRAAGAGKEANQATAGSKSPASNAPQAVAKADSPAAAGLAPGGQEATAVAPSVPPSPSPGVSSPGGVASGQFQDAVPAGFRTQINPASYDRSIPIPPTIEGIMAELGARNTEIQALIAKGAFSDIWVPAFQAKDLAIAIGEHATQFPTYKRTMLEPAIERLMRSAWLIDAFGDLGNREQINGAYAAFAAALAEIDSVVKTAR